MELTELPGTDALRSDTNVGQTKFKNETKMINNVNFDEFVMKIDGFMVVF